MKTSILDKCILKIAKFDYVAKTKSLFMLSTSPNKNEAINAAAMAVKSMKDNNIVFVGNTAISERGNNQLNSITQNYPSERLLNFSRAAARYLQNNTIDLEIQETTEYDFEDVDSFSEPSQQYGSKTSYKSSSESFDDSLFGRLRRTYDSHFEPINVGRFTVSIQANTHAYCDPRKNLPNGNMYNEFEVAFWDNLGKSQNFIEPLKDERFKDLSWAEKFSDEGEIGPYMSRREILKMINDLKKISNQPEIDKSYDKLPSDMFDDQE